MSLFSFSKKLPKPNEIVKSVKDGFTILEKSASNPKNVEKALEELTKSFEAMKITLVGNEEHEPNQETILILVNEIHSSDIIPLLITFIHKFDFEARKDLTKVFEVLLKRQVGSRSPTVDYIAKNTTILDALVLGYEIPESAKNCGTMLRECCKHEALTKLLLTSNQFWNFFKYVELSNFDVASDAFVTFKELLTKHKQLVAEFIEKYYEKFFESFTALLTSANYVTKRQSLKLLGELLLDRANFNVMTKYITEQQNLKLMMNLLREKSKNIQFEAFHVFKVFVANPNKPAPILHILVKNKEKLITFLSNFQNDKEDDQFNDEKAFLLKQIQQLPSDVWMSLFCI